MFLTIFVLVTVENPKKGQREVCQLMNIIFLFFYRVNFLHTKLIVYIYVLYMKQIIFHVKEKVSS